MANKYASEKQPTLFDRVDEPRGRHMVRWACSRCRATSCVPELFDTSKAPMLDAIARGHDRKSPACHDKHQLEHILVEQHGKRIAAALFGIS